MKGMNPEFTWTQRLVIFLASWVGWVAILILNSTLRIRVVGKEHHEPFRNTGRAVIMTCWHSQIFAATWIFRHQGAAVITSQHFDGEYIARIIERFGFKAIRGSSTRGGFRAALDVRKLVAEGRLIGIMVDGPKGPRHQVKPGVVQLAKLTGRPVIPMAFVCSRGHRFASWDRFLLPAPFTRCRIIYGRPMYVPANAGRAEEEMCLKELEAELCRITLKADRLFQHEIE